MLCPAMPPQACSAASAAATTPTVYTVLTASALACGQLEGFHGRASGLGPRPRAHTACDLACRQLEGYKMGYRAKATPAVYAVLTGSSFKQTELKRC